MNANTDNSKTQTLGLCLVTGAAGFVGSTLVRELLKRGLRVRALIRNTALDLEHPELECVSGDIQDARLMAEACRGVDTVFHTAAFVALLGGSAATKAYRDQAFAINVGGAENLIKACQDAGVKRLVHTSSVDVCFNSEVDMHMDESTPYATHYSCLYTETKIGAEKAVLAANDPQGLLTCSLRPDGIWGPVGNLMLDTLVKQLQDGNMVARIGGQGGHHDHVHVDNLVHAHLLAADALTANSPVCGKAYFISDGQPAAMFDFVKPFFEGLGYSVPKPNLPAAPLRITMRLWQWLHFKLGISPPLFTPHELNKLVISHVVYSDAAQRDFGYQAIRSVADGMDAAIESYRAHLGMSPPAKSQLHYRTCHLCETMCGIEVEYAGEQILAIRGDKNDVLSKGNICPKATGLQDINNCKDRLKKPIKRVRKNPHEKSHDDTWEEIEWEEALEYASSELARIQNTYGMDSVASYAGRSTAHNMGVLLATQPTRDIIGSRNIYTGSTVDQMPHNFVWYHMFGHQFLCTIPDINRTDYYLMLGTNPKISNGAQMATGANTYKKLNEIRARGGKCVLLDPRRTESAQYMDEHHFIKPHTDALFLIGVIKTIFAKGLDKAGRMEGHVQGWGQVKSAVQDFELPDISRETGIATADIERIAAEFASAKSAVCYGRTGISMVNFAGLTQWLMQVLNVITGNMDEVGGMTFPQPAIDSLDLSRSSWDRYRSRVSGRPEFSDEFPLVVLGEEILTPGEGQIRALLGFCGNMVLSMADGNHSEKALNALEFYVAVDMYRNETTRFADIILPPCGPFEKSHYDYFYHLYDTINWAKFSPKLFDTPESKWSDWEIFTELLGRFATKRAKNPIKKALISLAHKVVRNFISPELVTDLGLRFGRYGKGLNPFNKDGLTLKKLKENPHGIYLGEHSYTFPEGLRTENKKINLAPQVIVDDLPRLKAQFIEGGEARERENSEFDLKIISRLTNRTLGWMHHSRRLIKGKNPCELLIHPDDATARGIEADSLVKVTSNAGQIEIPVLISEDMMPGVVCMPSHWGHNRENTQQSIANGNPGVSMNDLTDVTVFDELTGNAIVNGVPVKVEAIAKRPGSEKRHADESVEEFVA